MMRMVRKKGGGGIEKLPGAWLASPYVNLDGLGDDGRRRMQQELKKWAKKVALDCFLSLSLSLSHKSSQKPRRHIGVSHGDMDFGHMGLCWTQTKQVRKVVKLARKRRDTLCTLQAR